MRTLADFHPPKKHVRGSIDLIGKEHFWTIKSIIHEDVPKFQAKGTEKKMVLYFEQSKLGVKISQTNGVELQKGLGIDIDGWVGQTVRVLDMEEPKPGGKKGQTHLVPRCFPAKHQAAENFTPVANMTWKQFVGHCLATLDVWDKNQDYNEVQFMVFMKYTLAIGGLSGDKIDKVKAYDEMSRTGVALHAFIMKIDEDYGQILDYLVEQKDSGMVYSIDDEQGIVDSFFASLRVDDPPTQEEALFEEFCERVLADKRLRPLKNHSNQAIENLMSGYDLLFSTMHADEIIEELVVKISNQADDKENGNVSIE